MLERDSGVHGFVQASQRLHFGLGDHEFARKVVVVWADGDKQIVRRVEANQHITITEDTLDDPAGGSRHGRAAMDAAEGHDDGSFKMEAADALAFPPTFDDPGLFAG